MTAVCRLCLVEDDDTLDIFSNTNVSLRIIQVTSLEVENEDGLSQRICTQCRLQLEDFYLFRKRCQAADRRLRQHKKLLSMDKTCDLYAPQDEDIFQFSRQRRVVEGSWRMLIERNVRSELEAHKKHLVDICKQELGAELVSQVRSELEAQCMDDMRKRCQLNILDELFFDLEEFLLRKRDEALLGVSTNHNTSDTTSGNTLVEVVEPIQTDHDLVNVVEIIERNENDAHCIKQEPLRVHNQTSTNNNHHNNTPGSNLQQSNSSLAPTPPMVEIPLQEVQLELYKEIPEKSISTITNLVKTTKNKDKRLQKSKPPMSNNAACICRRHAYWRKSKNYANLEISSNCTLCKLRKKKLSIRGGPPEMDKDSN